MSSREEATLQLFMVFYVVLFAILTVAMWGYGIYQGVPGFFGHGKEGGSKSGGAPLLKSEQNAQESLFAQGKRLYSSCSLCHGEQGEGNVALMAPALNRLSENYMVRQLVNFKEGKRGANAEDADGARMRAMAMTLADEESILAVSAYVNGLNSPLPKATINGNIEAGRVSYALCATCHGMNGEGNPAMGGPGLVGLQDWYLRSSLEKFKTGVRGYHAEDTPGGQMRAMAMAIPDEDALVNVVAYIVSLKGNEGRP